MHPQIQAYTEVFHGEFASRCSASGQTYADGDDAGNFCQKSVYQEPNEFGKRTVGFKLFFFHARKAENEYNLWRNLSADTSIKVIFLLRANIFDSYVSQQRSEQSGVWTLSPGERPPPAHGQPIFIDPIACENYMARTIAEMEWARRTFQHHRQITLQYEELQRDFQQSLDTTFGFLGEDRVPISLTFEKLNTAPHADSIMNFEDIVRYFRCSIFRDFFIS